jgi:hypothetical protein
MTWPDYLLERAIRHPDLDLGVIPGSTPVVAFGDPVAADIATLGINPSSTEFTDGSHTLLRGDDRRLATLGSLGVERYDQFTPDHAKVIVDECASYFDRRPYRWFTPLNDVLRTALDVSYAERTACHLDLVQWATRPLWGELPADIQDELLRADVGFLRAQLTSSGYRVVLVNGKSAMSWVQQCKVVRWQPVATLDGPPPAQFSIGQAGDTTFLGWSCNLQSQHGALANLAGLAELVVEHAGARRGRRAAAGTTRSEPPRHTDPIRGRRTTGQTSAGHLTTTDGSGPTPKGLRFVSKAELVAYLQMWLDHSTYDTIGDVGTYGGSAWLTVDSEAGPIGINRDTTREAVEALVDAAHTPRSYDWLVVMNQKGRINRVLFSEDRTPGWYAYLDEPPDRETRLGRGGGSQTPAQTSPAAPARARGDGPTSATAPSPTPSPAAPAAPARVRPAATSRPARLGAAGTTGEHVSIVQFPHPGREHVPLGSHMGWNRDSHARKFISCRGAYLGEHGEPVQDDLVFWGEWEAQSRVVRRWDRAPGLPTVLHEPYWSPPSGEAEWQNTDPWVFGDHFLYSNCKQHTDNTPARRPSALQSLRRGSVILFGSGKGGHFVLDTVFVVAGVLGRFVPASDTSHLPIDEAFDVCTVERLTGDGPHIAQSEYTLIAGATVDDPVHGMFSFVPCRRRDDRPMRFARPAIHLPGIVNPASHQSPSGGTPQDRRPIEDVVAAWHTVVDQVSEADLALGVRFETPPRATPTGAPLR